MYEVKKHKTIIGGPHLFEKSPKNTTPVQTLIRRDWVQSCHGAGGNDCIPYWFPSHLNKRTDGRMVDRKFIKYNRTDVVYRSLIKDLPKNNKRGLEIRSDIGRSTGFLATITDIVTVLEDAIEWVDIYDKQARNIAKRLGKPCCNIEWCYGNKKDNIKFNKYDWIKIEFNAMHMIEEAIQSVRQGGVIVCIGNLELIDNWRKAKWAKDLDIKQYQPERGNYGSNPVSYIYFSINTNTNGEKQ